MFRRVPSNNIIPFALSISDHIIPFTLSLSKGNSWFDKLTTNGAVLGCQQQPCGYEKARSAPYSARGRL